MTALRNVELKARDPEPERTLHAALAAGAQDQGVLHQRDTYFAAREGRLKLREERAGDAAPHAQLIAYARPDQATARTSAYHLVDVPDPAALTAALDASLGTVVVVDKTRRLLLRDNVRIHLDAVDGLGSWVELEAVAPPESDLAAEHAEVAALRATLGMSDDRVVATGYAALLLEAGAATPRLVDLARGAMQRAYAPYSHFNVGVALRDEAGGLHAGANVENGAYPQGQCAEASAIGALIAAGGSAIREVAVMADTELIVPCGGCRQRLAEFAGPQTPVHLCGPEGVRRTVALAQLLPLAFDLAEATA
ncbi:MAG TPA: cytidine deaminase [Baekduia sp.]|uniref:cytidine deaminase n=1 Tax=Baekduia sp. TaxID=2600305 RepID=UPI002CFC3FD0|nr:cytidine deaminase [Baekduia sp.]HMJ35135.1 cytidine deaminase [Baekduia sp.]